MEPIEERAQKQTMRAAVVYDTVLPIADRMEHLVLSGRRMTVHRRYVGSQGVGRFRSSLLADPQSFWGKGPFDRRDTADHRSWTVALEGIESFGIGASKGKWGDFDSESEAWQHFHEQRDHDRKGGGHFFGARHVETVEIEGFGEGADDHIVIERWNEHGVGQVTLVTFDQRDSQEEAREYAAAMRSLAMIAEREGPLTARHLRMIADVLSYRQEPLDVLLARWGVLVHHPEATMTHIAETDAWAYEIPSLSIVGLGFDAEQARADALAMLRAWVKENRYGLYAPQERPLRELRAFLGGVYSDPPREDAVVLTEMKRWVESAAAPAAD